MSVSQKVTNSLLVGVKIFHDTSLDDKRRRNIPVMGTVVRLVELLALGKSPSAVKRNNKRTLSLQNKLQV